MTRSRIIDFRSVVCLILTLTLCVCTVMPAYAEFTYYNITTTKKTTTSAQASEAEPQSPQDENADAPSTTAEPTTTSEQLSQLQEQYDKLEEKIQQGEKSLGELEDGKTQQNKNIQVIQSNIKDLDGQIDILEQRVSVLNSDITKLNSSITVLNSEIATLNSSITRTEDRIYETTCKTDYLYGKIKGRLVLNYMYGPVSNLEILVGVRDLPTLLTKLQIINNLSQYDQKIVDEFEKNLTELNNLNSVLSADKKALDVKQTSLSGEKETLSGRQSDMESSQYVLDLKKELSEHKYAEAVEYLKTLDKTSIEYNSVLRLLEKEQDKVDDQINAYLLRYGSSADKPAAEGVTNASGDGDASTSRTKPSQTKRTMPMISASYAPKTTQTSSENTPDASDITFPQTSVAVVSPESIDLIWPLPYKNCYISAYYGQYPSGGEHHGLDICVSGGTEGKNVVAAADGTVISYGFNHWSMGNYVIIDHGCGLFTAYYHMQKLFVEEGDHVKQGQVIGLAGHTGNTTGPHLHFEVRVSRGGTITRMDPLKFVSMPD
ncbi:MAG: peptidoglycan DD-metalloendopeptidase family protein [Clostridia bacterium]|nr:peptidoglycan DD-metalloendopeptidase family protein [Clostridia bacterium]